MAVNLPVPVTALQRFSYLFPQWTNGTPFTYQDGQTYAKLLEQLVAYIDSTLVPDTDEKMQAVIDAWKESTESLIELVLNNSLELQDPMLATLINDPDSEGRAALNAILAEVIQEDPEDPGTYMIFAPAVVPGDTGTGTPDPDNPGFWLD